MFYDSVILAIALGVIALSWNQYLWNKSQIEWNAAQSEINMQHTLAFLDLQMEIIQMKEAATQGKENADGTD